MSTHQPQITTIICTYRRPYLLRRAIESVLHQTYQDFQICIYDNASGDDTASVVAEFAQKDSRIKYYCHSENIGALGNYSYAIQQVSTPFFSFLADDDLVLPNFYAVAMAGFKLEPAAFFSATSFLCMSLQGNKVGGRKFESQVLQAPKGILDFMASGNPNLHGTLMRKEVIPERGGFMTHPWDDIDLLYRIAAIHPVVVCSEEGLLFMVHSINKACGNAVIDQAWLSVETVASSLKALLPPDTFQEIASISQKKIQYNLYFMSIDLIYAGDFAGARVGANKLKNEYKLYSQAFILNTLLFVFEKLPFILNFLRNARDIRPYIKGRKEENLTLSYAEIMNIYNNKKY
jgi:glycosyltransferase involved in cell wall biosynthesis